MEKTIDIVSLGTMYVDINAKQFPIGSGFLPHQEIVGDNYELVPGGSALNFARICNALDAKTVFIGKAGTDQMGDLLTQLVKESGVIPAFIRSEDVSTGISINYINGFESSIMTVVGNANKSLSALEVENKIQELNGTFTYLFLGSCFKLKSLLAHYKDIARKARTAGALVVLDHQRITNTVTREDKDIVRNLLSYVDIYLPSIDEFLGLLDAQTVEEGFQKVEKLTSAQVVVKDSVNGAITYENNSIKRHNAFRVDAVNTIGAGDSFDAGFIKAQKIGKNLSESIRFANATAALKISTHVLPTFDDVTNFLATH